MHSEELLTGSDGAEMGLVSKSVLLMYVVQISPFPMDLVKAEVQKYPNAKLMWVQEEPKNMGAWSYTRPRFEATLKKEGSGRTIK